MNIGRFYTRRTTGSKTMSVAQGEQQFEGFRELQEEKATLLAAIEQIEPLDERGTVFAQEIPGLYGWSVMGRVVEGQVQEFKAKYAAGSSFTRIEYERQSQGEQLKRTDFFEGMTAEPLSATETRARVRGDEVELKEFDFWEPFDSDVFQRDDWIVEGRRRALSSMAETPVSDKWVSQVRGLSDEEPEVVALWLATIQRFDTRDRLPGLVELLAKEPGSNFQVLNGRMREHPGWARFQNLVNILGTRPEELQNASQALAWIDQQRDKGVSEEEALQQFLSSQLPRQATSAVAIEMDEEYLLVGDHSVALS